MSDDYQALSDIVKSKDAEIVRLREREAQLEMELSLPRLVQARAEKARDEWAERAETAEARVQELKRESESRRQRAEHQRDRVEELEAALREIAGKRIAYGGPDSDWWLIARRALEPRAEATGDGPH